VVRRGESLQLCYGVSNAAAVKIEPGLEPVQPALSRCLSVRPKRSTDYVITATGAKGDSVTQTLKVLVQ